MRGLAADEADSADAFANGHLAAFTFTWGRKCRPDPYIHRPDLIEAAAYSRHRCCCSLPMSNRRRNSPESGADSAGVDMICLISCTWQHIMMPFLRVCISGRAGELPVACNCPWPERSTRSDSYFRENSNQCRPWARSHGLGVAGCTWGAGLMQPVYRSRCGFGCEITARHTRCGITARLTRFWYNARQ